MRKLILKMSMSLDGYVAGPNGEGGWIIRTGDPEGKAWVGQTLEEAGAHLMGHRTYEAMKGYWPTSTDPLAELMNSIPKVVFSRSAEPDPAPSTGPGWDEARFLGADLAADVEALNAEAGKGSLAQGGVEFARSLVGLGLVDEYRLVRHPVVLGSGLGIFDGAEEFDLTLTDAKTFGSGTQALTYVPS